MRFNINIISTFALLIGLAVPAANADIPPRPEQIDFPPLSFEPPDAADYRHELDGVPVYLAPSREFPLINISFTFKGGEYLDDPDMIGLARATGQMMRRGGAGSYTAEAMDEELDYLAAIATTFCGPRASNATLNCLSTNLDQSLDLFMDILRRPRFQEDRLRIYQDEEIERIKQRNDEAGAIAARQWAALMFGEDHFEGRLATAEMINSLSPAALGRMHERIFHPGNLIIAVSGDFDVDDMIRKLEHALSGWAAGPRADDPPPPMTVITPGVYHLEKDIPQGVVFAGMRSITRDDPDYFPALLMNRILGGSGFTSRITQRVRTDEGLAYDARSIMTMPYYYPGLFRASFQTRSGTVALGLKLVFEEIDRIRTELVDAEELKTAKNALIETFPRTFESKPAMLNVFVADEMTFRRAGYWRDYRDNVRAVTAEEIRAVAQRILLPEQMAILVVGKWDDVVKGDLDGRADMSLFFGGRSTELPLLDPLTLEPLD